LPPLWEQSGEEHLLKQAILTLLTRLIVSLGEQSQPYHSSFLPLIRYSLDPTSDAHVYLLEEALDLWYALVQCIPRPVTPEFLELMPLMLPILDTATPNFKKSLEIAESYILLAPHEILGSSIPDMLLPYLATSIGPNLNSDAMSQITIVIEFLIRSSHVEGREFLPRLARSMIETKFFEKVVTELRKNWESNQSKNPPVIDSFIETDYLNILSRLILADPQTFAAMMESVAIGFAPGNGDVLTQSMNWILTEWFENFENMSSPHYRKLQCLALTKLLETGQPWILSRMQDLLTVWTDVIIEVREADGTE
jgi:hypothetical protein